MGPGFESLEVHQTSSRVLYAHGIFCLPFWPPASSKGAIESLAKCLDIENAADGISFHLFHPSAPRHAHSRRRDLRHSASVYRKIKSKSLIGILIGWYIF